MDNNPEKSKGKRIAALIGVILLVIMVIATLITAFADPTGVYFRSCLIVTIALPIAIWVFLWAYGAMTHKHTMASYDLNLDALDHKKDDSSDTEPKKGDASDPGSSSTGEELSPEQAEDTV